ncbi:MAG: Hsp33 family molecular chaperone HslO [Pseudomonadota bacterium]
MSADSDDRPNALINFMFSKMPVRGALVQLDSQWRELAGQHDYVPIVSSLLGQSIAASAMMASTMKFEGMLTLQLTGAGSLGMLIAQCNQSLHVRGMAGELDLDTAHDSFAALAGAGRLTLTVDAKDAKDRYQGIIEVRPESLAATLGAYYLESAQLAAHFVLLADAQNLCGVMLQRLPDADGLDDDDWRRLCLMADTLTLDEMRAGAGITMLSKLFAEDDVIAYEHQDVVFRCRCSDERAEAAVRMLGEADARQLLEERDQQIEIVCEFCNAKRILDPVDVARLFNPASMASDAGLQ